MDFLPHEAENQDEFIYASFELYRRKSIWLGGIDYREDVIVWLYKLGRDYQVLFMDFEEYKRVILGQHKDYSYYNGARYHKRWDRRRYYGGRSHYCRIEEYRVLKGFTYNGQAKKDKPTKKDWWEHKQIVRDRRQDMHGWRRGWGKDFKHFNKRKHRQLERQAIKKERYDKLHWLTYKQAENPWSWD